tara:strand:+ start:630 stop:944 length:315 start_codon:yes stop_codon:yes gene_type:complete
MRKEAILLTAILLAACQTTSNRTPLYRDVSGQERSDGQLAMSQAYCRNRVNSHVTPYEGPSGTYSTSKTGVALNRAIGSVSKAMSGPNYRDCMLSQGFEFVRYE